MFPDFTETKAELNGGRAQGSSALGAVTVFLTYQPPPSTANYPFPVYQPPF